MGFNRRKMEADRKAKAGAEAAEPDWNERQAQRMPLLFAPTIGGAPAARHWLLWDAVRPAAPLNPSSCAVDRRSRRGSD